MWKDLSMSQRAEVIQLAIKNGMRDLNQIGSFYDNTVKRFDKGGKISDEEYYATMERVAEENNPSWNKQRIAEGGKPLSVEEDLIRILNDNRYDYRGFYNKYPPTAADADSHWTDEFKTAYHPTFSDESIYSGKKSQYNPYGYRGGHWVGDTFFPEYWQMEDKNRFPEGGPKKGITQNLHWLTRPAASIRDLALWGADIMGAPSHVTNAVRDISNRVANLPVIGAEAAYNRLVGNSDNWSDAFKEADTNPAPFFQAFEVFPMTNTESNYSQEQLENQYLLREHSPGKPGQITHDGYRYANEGRYAGDIEASNFFSPTKVNEWSIGQSSGVTDDEGETYTSDLFAYDKKDTDNVYLKAVKEGTASPAMLLRGILGTIGAKGYDDGTNSATAIRTKINTKAQRKAAEKIRNGK